MAQNLPQRERQEAKAQPSGLSSESATRRLPASFFLTLGFIQAIWPLTMDLYLSAFPQIERHLSTSPALVQFTLTGAFVGMAVGQLVAGPLSDRVGRIRPLLVALVIYAIASTGCALAPSIEVLIGLRAVQGVGASATAVIILAIVRDRAEGPLMVKLLARLQLINGVFVVASPAIGAQLLRLTDWRGLFWLLVAYGCVILLATLLVLARHESNPPERRALRQNARLRTDYRELARDGLYRTALGAGALQFAAMMSYMASSAFLFQGVFGLDETQYALIFGGHGALMIAGAQVTARLAGRVDITRIARAGGVGLFLVALTLLAGQLLVPGWGLLAFVIPLFLFTTLFGVVSPTLQGTAMKNHGLRAGAAASMLGASNMVAGALAAPLVGLFGVTSTVPAAAVMTVCTGLSAVVLLVGFRGGVSSVPRERSRR